MRYRIAVFVFIVLFSVSGCKMMEPFIAKPTVSLEKMTLQDMSLFDATLLFTLSVSNPNPMGILIQKGTYDFAVEGTSLVRGTVDETIRVGAGASGSIDLPVYFDFLDFFDSARALAGRDDVAYTLSGSLDVMGFAIPYKTDGRLTLPKFPEISVETMNIADFSLAGAAFNIIFAVRNPNAFSIGLDRLRYVLDMGDGPLLSGVAEGVPAIGENERARLSVPVELDFISMGRWAVQAFQKNTASYSLSGEMRFDLPGGETANLPFSRTGELILRR